MPETKAERLKRERKENLDYLQRRLGRLIQTIESLPEPKAQPKNPTYPLRRKHAHQKIREDLERLIEIAAGDTLDAWALAGIINILRKLVPLDKDWQTVYVKKPEPKEEHKIILEEDAKLEDEGARMYGRSGKILSRSRRLQELLSSNPNPERYINDIKRKKYEK